MGEAGAILGRGSMEKAAGSAGGMAFLEWRGEAAESIGDPFLSTRVVEELEMFMSFCLEDMECWVMEIEAPSSFERGSVFESLV